MPTEQEWAEIARQLQAPFDPADVKRKKGRGGKMLDYIDARAVAARLDAVVGPGNWSFNWEPMVIQRPERGVVWEDQGWKDGEKLPPIKKLAPEPEVDAVCVAKGILTIHGVSKADIGYAGPIEPNKASISNALRRCAALWGIGRYLYNQEQRPAQQGYQAQNASQQESRVQSNGARRPNSAQVISEAHSANQGQGDQSKELATPEQVQTIRELVMPAGKTMDQLCAELRIVAVGNLTAHRAAAVIHRLQELADARTPQPAAAN